MNELETGPKVAKLVPRPLTAQAFAPYGQVIEKNDSNIEEINYGNTRKYSDLADFDAADGGGRLSLHLFHSRTIDLPLQITELERHPLGSQAFIPLHQRPFLVVVAKAGTPPGSNEIEAFYSNGQQGVNYHKGTWHHYLINLSEPADYLIIDRMGPGENCEFHRLEHPPVVERLPL